MNASAEDSNLDKVELDASLENSDENPTKEVDKKSELVGSSEFALKMINAVKSMNNDEISHYEMVNSFTIADELKCLFMFIKALPYSPIVPMYPETPFLFFKGVLFVLRAVSQSPKFCLPMASRSSSPTSRPSRWWSRLMAASTAASAILTRPRTRRAQRHRQVLRSWRRSRASTRCTGS